ncbi:putative peptidyl-prolyl cis-trans isomerase [Weissella viridescens]|jgi:peptidyl-prolyl cis-trans isomerase B (cyclophilin B)|uniref:Peptidyl-prolyl cis-trans isomerase n=1 Tax=Weissella viridescens TaxID=1629 RepID=A0A0R2H271_WEIVI|nr:peptidylprolyl isomerase [Weissella viridescens]KRN46712.1 peptidylprolyl isomerase [Weissella viridescens]MBX4172755.1 peptidylprolyl isomerase [Weissella viridescens]GEA94564.1 peptidyl-prolyl cis-trans isomerase [Weissella viridescens]SOB42200.1 putative peptidyl-prolyl cis-trans isomerase [Weissella viridescens]
MTLLQAQAETIEGPVAQFETTKGIIKFRLFPEQAPKTVENFMGLISDNYYDGTIFHRVIADFMLQGGDPSGTGMGGTSIYGKKFNDEFSSELFNFRGALSMANSGPNTNGSQFFIVQATRVPAKMLRSLKGEVSDEVIDYYAQNGGTPWLDGRHTVFGQVIEGMDVVDAIAKTKVDYADKPKENIEIIKATIVD